MTTQKLINTSIFQGWVEVAGLFRAEYKGDSSWSVYLWDGDSSYVHASVVSADSDASADKIWSAHNAAAIEQEVAAYWAFVG